MSNSPVTYVVFGATGNLAQIKIMPALCALFESEKLSSESQIIAYSRRPWGDVDYREFIRPLLNKYNNELVARFLEIITYTQGEFHESDSYIKLKDRIINKNVFLHLAVLPESYIDIVKGLGGASIAGSLLIEKPFGYSSDSAQTLEDSIEQFFPEDKIFRIDHYLGKKGIKEILSKKQNDPVFEKGLSSENVSKITVQFRETIDIQGRGEFYDKTGAFRDMGQSHGLQVLATVLMDVGIDLNESRANAIQSLAYVPRSFIRGQYEGYREEKGVNKDSQVETYFRLGLSSYEDRWNGVEMFIEAGKALESDARKEEVIIYYNDGSNYVFNLDTPKHYNAYESVILSAFENDKSSFVSLREVESLWKCSDEILSNVDNLPMVYYKKGQGPNLVNI